MEMRERLIELANRARSRIEEASDPKDLNEARIAFLGKKGELTALLKGMRDVSPEDRPVVGQLVNDTREKIEKLLEESRRSIEAALLNERLEVETLDVTLPAKKNRIGHRGQAFRKIKEILLAEDRS